MLQCSKLVDLLLTVLLTLVYVEIIGMDEDITLLHFIV